MGKCANELLPLVLLLHQSLLVLVGPPGCGKSHLGQVWGQSAGAVEYVGRNTAICSSQPCVFVDNAESADDDEEFFHVFNAVVAADGFLLVTARTPPVRWVKGLSDLTSRLSAAPNIRIYPPDETLITAVIIKMFADQKMDVGADVLTYLINRMERSFETARTLVRRLNNASLAKRRAVTIPLAREVFKEMFSGM